MPGSSFVPLGHMLTHKVAYQIVTGLAYLHKKNIIFCDLKSDNILVWSLDIKEHINIKLSDYGISRQSFHEGALGVEGTPGYQAPEIRPRIVYDEKVTVVYPWAQPLRDSGGWLSSCMGLNSLIHVWCAALAFPPEPSLLSSLPANGGLPWFFLSVSGSRLTCSHMGWSCMNCCLVSGLS